MFRGEHVKLNLTNAECMNAACHSFLGIDLNSGAPGSLDAAWHLQALHVLCDGILQEWAWAWKVQVETSYFYDCFGYPIVALC